MHCALATYGFAPLLLPDDSALVDLHDWFAQLIACHSGWVIFLEVVFRHFAEIKRLPFLVIMDQPLSNVQRTAGSYASFHGMHFIQLFSICIVQTWCISVPGPPVEEVANDDKGVVVICESEGCGVS